MKKIILIVIFVICLTVVMLLSLNRIEISGEYNSEEKNLYYTIHNISLEEIYYGRDFELYRIIDDSKEVINTKTNVFLSSELLKLKPLKKAELILSINDLYGDLADGRYVLVKTYKEKKSDDFLRLNLTFEIESN